MNGEDEVQSEFERRTKALLESRAVDERVRARLARARYAAVEAASPRVRSGFWQTLAGTSRGVAPAGVVAAVLVVVLLLSTDRAERTVPGAAPSTAYEDVEMLADGEALELMEEWDGGFYEWAVAEADDSGASG